MIKWILFIVSFIVFFSIQLNEYCHLLLNWIIHYTYMNLLITFFAFKLINTLKSGTLVTPAYKLQGKFCHFQHFFISDKMRLVWYTFIINSNFVTALYKLLGVFVFKFDFFFSIMAAVYVPDFRVITVAITTSSIGIIVNH